MAFAVSRKATDDIQQLRDRINGTVDATPNVPCNRVAGIARNVVGTMTW